MKFRIKFINSKNYKIIREQLMLIKKMLNFLSSFEQYTFFSDNIQ